MRRPLALFVAILCVAGPVPTSLAQTIEAFGVGKKRDFLQTSAATPVSSVIIGDPIGPYHFSADLSGNSLNLLNPAPKVTTPSATQYILSGDSADMGIVGNYSNKSALDAAFPNSAGSYTFTAGGKSLPISLGSSDAYPTDVPQITNGTWNSQGQLVADPTTTLTVNFSSFSGYSSGAGGMVTFSLYSVSGSTVTGELRAAESVTLSGFQSDPMLTSYSIGGGSLQANQTYYAELSFVRITNLNTNFINSSGVGPVGTAAFVNTTGFMISTAPPLVAPFFLVNPANQTVYSTKAAQFVASATGNPANPTYQWQRLPAGGSAWTNLDEDGIYSGTTTTILNLASTTDGMNGDQFRCVATNSVGSTNSSAVTLTVVPKVSIVITQQPTSREVTPGASVTFSVAATGGTGPLAYHWFFNDSSWSIGPTLTLPSVQARDLGNYQVLITDALGSVGSERANLSFSPPAGPGVVAVSTGYSTTLMIRSDGSLWGMGRNAEGQLGDGTFTDREAPVQIASDVVAASVFAAHSLFIKSDRTLWGTGSYGMGQFSDGSYTTATPRQIATDVVSAVVGNGFSLFIRSDGSLWAVGNNTYGQLGDGTTTNRDTPVQIATGVVAISASWHSLFIKADGTLWGMGYNFYSQLGDGSGINRSTPVQIATGVTAANAGLEHSLFITTDGTLWAMGRGDRGQLGIGQYTSISMTPLSVANGVVAACAGGESSMFVKTDHTLWGMGSNGYYLSGNESGGIVRSPLLMANGVASASRIGGYNTYITTQGTLKGWGENSSGQLGAGIRAQYRSPITLAQGPLSLPIAPSGASATDGIPVPGIRVTWNPTIAATQYEVWRNTTNDSASAVRIAGTVPIALFYDLTAVPGMTYYYWIKAANPAGASAFSVSDAGIIEGPPVFTIQPASQIATVGALISFTAVATGAPTPTLQWQKGGVNIPGATSSSYAIANVSAGDVSSYTVVATNAVGSTTSNVATLTLGTVPAGFDVQAYLTRYPDVAAIYGANPYAAWGYYRDHGIYQGEVFDELFRVEEYLALYPDLAAIFGSDFGAALDHWLSTGRIEGKLGRIPLEFKAQGYFDRNPDVATAVNNNPILAWGHYWAYGIYEGRAYDDELRVFEYLAINSDLTAAFLNDWRTAALHWMRYGRTEGRLGRLPLTFSVATYLSRNPDVAAVWGTDPTTVFLHFWLYGINEGRTYDDLFRVDDYLALNPDLAGTFGTDRRGAFKHWVRYGQSEGRPAKNP